MLRSSMPSYSGSLNWASPIPEVRSLRVLASGISMTRCGGSGIISRFLLLVDGQDASTMDAAKQLCESFRGVVELRPDRDHGIKLVRPDGYLAYSADKSDSTALEQV